MSIKISSDSTCDLSAELIAAHHIDITPLYIVMEGKSLRDGLEITADDLFRHVESTGKLASTAAVNVEDYTAFFAEQKKTHDAVIHFTISSEMSCCYQNACLAAQEFANVYVIDSRSLSTGIGLLVLDAAQMAESSMSAGEIVQAIEAKKEKLDVSFVINTLEYLRKGGRCSAMTAMGANLLGIKPSIEVHEGKMGVAKKYRGQFERCLEKYVADKLGNPETIDTGRVFITDSGVADGVFERVREEVLKRVPFESVLHTRAGCTISNHCGPNCLGLLFYRK